MLHEIPIQQFAQRIAVKVPGTWVLMLRPISRPHS